MLSKLEQAQAAQLRSKGGLGLYHLLRRHRSRDIDRLLEGYPGACYYFLLANPG